KAGESVYTYYKKNTDLGEVVGFLSNGEARCNGMPILGDVTDFQKVYEKKPVTELIITLQMSSYHDTITKLIRQAEYNGVRPRVVADYNYMFNRHYEMQKLGKFPVINIREFPLSKYYNRFWKRAFDIIFSSLALLICFPIFLIIIVAIKLESKGPVFYKPKRGGKTGSVITLWKFRSMKYNDDP